MSVEPNDLAADDAEAERASADSETLRDPRLARIGLATGIASIVLAPIAVGAFPAAIGLHSALTHLRFRRGSRTLAWAGAACSALGAVVSLAAAILWGALLLNVLLQRSAVHQAQSWVGITPNSWTLTDVAGVAHTSDSMRGRVVLLDCFAPVDAYCEATTRAIAEFAAAHPEAVVLSWAPEATASDASSFASKCGVRHPVCAGPQAMPEPLTGVAAKPTLVVFDAAGTIRATVLGRYNANDLAKLVDAAAVPATAPTSPRMPRPG
ncbi:MAG: hypothetical protein U0572_10005 [Phycisphaerales bacterium]